MKALVNPKTGKRDIFYTLTALAMLGATLKFLAEGVEVTIMGHVLNLGHADPLSYGAFLAPVLGAHGYVHSNDKNGDGVIDEKDK